MAKTLWLLRHGEAVPHGSRASDADRELTPKGEHQARSAGRALAQLNVEVDGCYASPKVRALDTARLACEELGIAPVTDDAIGGGFDRRHAEELLLAHGAGACVLVAGHNPDLEQVVHDFTGARVDLKKGGAAAVRIDGASADLIVLLRPAELETMAGAGH